MMKMRPAIRNKKEETERILGKQYNKEYLKKQAEAQKKLQTQ